MQDNRKSHPRNDGSNDSTKNERSFCFNGEGQNTALDFEKFSLHNLYSTWQDVYKDKFTTAEEAIKSIKNNDHIVFGHSAGVPQVVPATMAAHHREFNNVKIYHMLTFDLGLCYAENMSSNFRHVTNFAGANTRQALADNRADFFPSFFSQVPALFDAVFPVDVAIIQVSRPDRNGNCSFGTSCDYTKPAAEKAKIVIAEMNDQMPYVYGENYIHISKFTHIIPVSYPLYELPPAQITDIERRIGQYCASLIEDGSTLQMGIGNIPNAVLGFLKDKKDLGIHTEMFSDGIIDLVELGVINGSKKTLHRGKLIATFLAGTKRLYDFVHCNSYIDLYPVDYVNDPRIIAKNDNMVSINSCIEVDLMGQVASETIGTKQFSGAGGQMDFVRGTSWSKGGKSIIAMPSTAAKGTVSRIVSQLTPGASVTTSRNDVQYIVTEYGIAHLRGKTLNERAESLIAIAHPDFRDKLREEYNNK